MLRVTSRVIMVGVCALLWGTPAAVAGAQATATSELEKLRNQFVGSYRLAWYKNYDAAGHETTLPYASGQISFDRAGRIVAMAQREFTQHYPQPGWVEHDPMEIWSTQLATAREALARAGITAAQLAGIGITNQRETTVVWNRQIGRAHV